MKITQIASIFAIIHRSKFLRKCFVRHLEALAEESIGVFFMFPGFFTFAQDDVLCWEKVKTIVNKIITGIRKNSEFPKFKNSVKIRILPVNARKSII